MAVRTLRGRVHFRGPGRPGAAACWPRTAACGVELQGALSASGRAGAWRSRQGALRIPAPSAPAACARHRRLRSRQEELAAVENPPRSNGGRDRRR